MILKINRSLNTQDLKFAQSFTDRFLGLLRKNNPRFLLFKTRFGIHTFFLRETIDVLILNRDYIVVKVKKNLKPNRFFFWNPKYFLVLELPANSILKYKIQTDNHATIK